VVWKGQAGERQYQYSTDFRGLREVALVTSIQDVIEEGMQLDVARGPQWRFGNQNGGTNVLAPCPCGRACGP
jgi:hypothetical protein